MVKSFMGRDQPTEDTGIVQCKEGRIDDPRRAADLGGDGPARATVPLSGRVAGPDGRPVAGAEVMLAGRRSTIRRSWRVPGRTARAGS